VVHEQRKDHACPQCDAAFGQSSNLAKHVRGVHGIVNGGSGGKQRAPPVASAGQKRMRPAAKDGQSAAAAAGCRDRGHWIFLNSQGMVDHMVDHMGANGLAVAGFFISKKHYRDAEVRLCARSVCPAAFASTPRAPRAPRSPRSRPPILRRRFAAG